MLEDALSETEKVNVRRYCWYPARGNSHVSGSWLYFSHYGILEHRLCNFSNEEIKIIRIMLSNLSILEKGPISSADNLDTYKAAVWTHNKNEFSDRVNLFKQQRLELVKFIGIDVGPGFQSLSIKFSV
ncbi:hypothetical protein [Acetobacter sp.]|jgi:hypothetical protein|uniref:hypothetical protein n=1 Tax=Acetobacter sp. TaxID=440 RepID=UPI0025BAEC7B|nr:hypothetical protein [Acetobacter sp.]MCH4091554.1 hypothetical protein [Acetobacter sp.]MCI1299532.1 hypothetical protein [Acetobacter sp.]MCI1316878.1 hypothetical protein [Acetobacter sp.]